jgi:NAD(P)-dependent dehydrogenase (short-subunit alcohol dehydrogenase family)
MISAASVSSLLERLSDASIEAIVHCGWPAPDNQRLTSLPAVGSALQYHLADPLAYVIELAQLLSERGTPGAMLILVGSTFANPGRHSYRMPLYSMAKATLVTLTKVLALELGAKGKRCLCLNFDVIDGGMNASISRAVRIGHADRSPWAELATPATAAEQVVWILGNSSHLASGAIIEVSGGAVP